VTARLALVGAPGAGKSQVGEELARRWGCPLLDTDLRYESAYGASVAEAVIDDEAGFRRDEQQVVLDALAQDGAVVAVGSGAVSPAVLDALVRVPVVWLEVGLAEAVRRAGLSGMRPVALGNVRAQFHQMLQERAQVYAGVADVTVTTNGRNAAAVADEIEEWEARG
jgi:shikimate kinase